MSRPAWRAAPPDLRDGDRRVFIPAIMGAGLVFSVVTVLVDVLRSRQGRAPGFDRRLDFAGHASAHHVLTGDPPAEGIRPAARPKVYYVLVAVTSLGVALYVGVGATVNYFDSYVSGTAWLWALSLLLTATLTWVGVLAVRVALHRSALAPSVIRGLVSTPLSRPSGVYADVEASRLLLGWASIVFFAVTVILVLMVGLTRTVFDRVDATLTEHVLGWEWLSALPIDVIGRTEPSVVLAVLIGISTLRCRVFALGYIAAMGGGWAAYAILKEVVEQPRPEYGFWTGQADSFPSGHLVQATVIAGLVPFAFVVYTNRWWLARLVAIPMMLGVLVTGAYRVHMGAHWVSDVAGGVLIGVTLVLAVHWALQHRQWHRRCARRCPWKPSGRDAQA